MKPCFFCGKDVPIIKTFSSGEVTCKSCLDEFHYEEPEREDEEEWDME